MTVVVIRTDRACAIRGVRDVLYPFEVDAAALQQPVKGTADSLERWVAMIILNDTPENAPRVKEVDARGGEFPLVVTTLPRARDNRVHHVTCVLLRALVDRSWRHRAIRAIVGVLPSTHPTCATLVAMLREDGPLRASSFYSSSLPTIPQRAACASTVSMVPPHMKAREAQDWVLCLRIAARHPFGVTVEQLASELGVSLRTVKRIRMRLANALPAARFWTPQGVTQALVRRLTPPPERTLEAALIALCVEIDSGLTIPQDGCSGVNTNLPLRFERLRGIYASVARSRPTPWGELRLGASTGGKRGHDRGRVTDAPCGAHVARPASPIRCGSRRPHALEEFADRAS